MGQLTEPNEEQPAPHITKTWVIASDIQDLPKSQLHVWGPFTARESSFRLLLYLGQTGLLTKEIEEWLRQQTLRFLKSDKVNPATESMWAGQERKIPQLLGKSKMWSCSDHDVAFRKRGRLWWPDGGYLLLPAPLWTLALSYQMPVAVHSFPNSPSIQQFLRGVHSCYWQFEGSSCSLLTCVPCWRPL